MTIMQLPATPAPSDVSVRGVDVGLTLDPPTGAGAIRVNRPGNRFELDVTYPPMRAVTVRPFVARLLQAKRQGLRMFFPLLGASQGSPGAPLVNGSGAAGTSVPLKGLTVGYVVQEGYWLTVIDSEGIYYLHNVAVGGTANGSGQLTLTIEPPLRAPLVNNNVVLLQAPMVEGLIVSDVGWPLPPNRLITISFTLRESS